MVFSEPNVLSTRQATVTAPTGTGQRTLLHDVTVTLTANRTAVLGLNGSGKSTFLRLFNGLAPLSSGKVTVHGLSVYENLNHVRSHVGMLFSDPGAQLVMPTGVEDVELSFQHIKDRKERREKALTQLAHQGVEQRAFDPIYNLSGGEKQLTALSAVLAVEPSMLLLDEPTTLLDLRNRLKLIELLDTLPQQLLISTHDLELAATCTEALVIHEGRLLAQGPTASILSDYRRWCAEGFPALDSEPTAESPEENHP
ncbi:energy-coupling factor ABC transporter ATP-binding protein [Rothia sp. P5764]|uniref:energy-coupling factor ABC transporter ATP-binding protein n=1 Tax=Rothia sp. P5764 TaxID=3402654 RepID=UPI003ACC55F9